jgi:hypothetical protein
VDVHILVFDPFFAVNWLQKSDQLITGNSDRKSALIQ